MSRIALDDFLLQRWLPTVGDSLQPTTLDSYKRIIGCHIVPALGRRQLQSLRPVDLNDFYAGLSSPSAARRRGLSTKTVRNIHVVLRKSLADAVKWGLLYRNPAESADPPRLRGTSGLQLKTWTAEELKVFLSEVITGDRLALAYELAAMTGMRRGEILGLRWEDVSLSEGRLAVRQTVVSVNNQITFSTPKTERSRRSVPITPRLIPKLRRHRSTQNEERLAWGADYLPHDLVFAAEDGHPVQPDGFSKVFAQHLKNSGLPTIRLHDLRHTFATLALQAGVQPKVVSEILGHSSVAFTMDRYAHVIPAMQESAVALVADLIFDSSAN